jgi:hypothetical protein
MPFSTRGEVSIELGNLLDVEADVVAAIVAGGTYGPTRELVGALQRGRALESEYEAHPGELRRGESLLVETKGSIRARYALFVGSRGVREVGYADIGAFAEAVIGALDRAPAGLRHLVMVAHGTGFGLDGIEAFLAAVDGWMTALARGVMPRDLERITYVEASAQKLKQMADAFEAAASAGALPADLVRIGDTQWIVRVREAWKSVGVAPQVGGFQSDRKKHVFVAMPFAEDFEDVFYFGILEPVRQRGLLCERVDQAVFTGDVLDQIRQRIEDASLVIGELTGANPNVYLEIGYAWGKGRPTMLLLRTGEELRFDVQGQKVLVYKSIKQLREALDRELAGLIDQGKL